MTNRLKLLMQFSLAIFGLAAVAQGPSQRLAGARQPKDNVILGVLEDIPGEYSGESDFRAVRAVFEKIGDHWQAFPTSTKSYRDLQTLPISYPREMTWTIAFDGRNLGTITSRTPPHFAFYSEIGIEQITSHSQVPTVGRKSADYSGFQSVPVYRPLVAVSQPNFSDPDQWKPDPLAPALISAAREQFRNRFPKVSNCSSPEKNILTPWNYRDEDIKVAKSYSSRNGWSLIELNLTGNACDVDQGQKAFDGQWYVINPFGRASFLGMNMWLVDAGDYDDSGSSQVLFSIDSDNTGGYRIFYQNFAKSAEFSFNYH